MLDAVTGVATGTCSDAARDGRSVEARRLCRTSQARKGQGVAAAQARRSTL